MNHQAIDKAVDGLKEIAYPAEWATAELDAVVKIDAPEFVTDVLLPQLAMQGNDLPVSKFAADGFVQPGTTKYEKRGIATVIPVWNSEKCTTCNMCSLYCPHSAIRPFLLNEEEVAKAPESFTTINMKGAGEVAKYKFRVQVSALDCTGCTVCTTACPTNCLTMKDFAEVHEVETKNWDYAMTLPARNELADRSNIRGTMLQSRTSSSRVRARAATRRRWSSCSRSCSVSAS